MEIKLTGFKSTYDNDTTNTLTFGSIPAFEEFLYELAGRPCVKPRKGQPRTDRDAFLISPAVFSDGTTRANSNVECWNRWVALDVDSYDGTMEDVLRNFEQYHYVCYNTGSSTVEHPKFRVVLFLTDIVSAGEVRALWHALNQRFPGLIDKQTCDPARIYFIPGQYEEAHNFIFTNEGEIINPSELMVEFPYIPAENGNSFFEKLPPELQEMILSEKKANALNTSGVRWTSFSDCPFVNKKKLAEYQAMTSGDQWYHGLYSVMTSIASSAVYAKYPITSQEVATLAAEIHQATRGFPSTRKLDTEAQRAIAYAYSRSMK